MRALLLASALAQPPLLWAAGERTNALALPLTLCLSNEIKKLHVDP